MGVTDRELLAPWTLDSTSEDDLRDKTAILLEALGAESDETDLIVSTLKAAGGSIGGTDNVRDVFKKVHVSRKIAETPIGGDYLVATYDLDGTFRKAVGKWRRIDGARSSLTSSMSVHEALEFVAAELAEMQIPLRDTVYSIDISSAYCFEPAPRSESWSIGICAAASFRDINGNGHGQEGKIPVYQFRLPS